MAYPDYIANAPNYAGQFGNIFKINSEMSSDQMSNWLKATQAAKIQQDISLEPQKEQSEEDLRQANIDRMHAVTDQENLLMPGKFTSQQFQNSLSEIAVKKAAADAADKALAEQYTSDALQLSPTDFPGEKGTDLLNSYASRASDPNFIYNAQSNIVKGNPAYGVATAYEAEKRMASPDARQAADDAQNTTGSIDQGMTALRLKSQQEAAQRAADEAGAKAEAITRGQIDAGKGRLTPAMVNAAKALDGMLDKDDTYSELAPDKKGAIKAEIMQGIIKSGGNVDPILVQAAIKKYTQPSVDYFFQK